jgi:hypothetical protein
VRHAERYQQLSKTQQRLVHRIIDMDEFYRSTLMNAPMVMAGLQIARLLRCR